MYKIRTLLQANQEDIWGYYRGLDAKKDRIGESGRGATSTISPQKTIG